MIFRRFLQECSRLWIFRVPLISYLSHTCECGSPTARTRDNKQVLSLKSETHPGTWYVNQSSSSKHGSPNVNSVNLRHFLNKQLFLLYGILVVISCCLWPWTFLLVFLLLLSSFLLLLMGSLKEHYFSNSIQSQMTELSNAYRSLDGFIGDESVNSVWSCFLVLL